MSIRKRGKSYQIDYMDPTGKRVRKSFRKRKDAEAELGKRISLIAEKRYLDVKKEYTTTLGELVEKYTENFRHQPCFVKGKQFHLTSILEYFGEHTRLADIRYVDLETYRNNLKLKPTRKGTLRSVASVNREMACFHHLFTKAFEWDMIEQNPFDKGKSLIMKENNMRFRYLSKDEIGRLLAECKCRPYLYRIISCAINTGMRRGEILNLRWDQIRNDVIYLQHGIKDNEPRQVPVNDDLKAILREIRKEQGLSSQYVFTYKTGKKNDARTVTRVDRAFHSVLRGAGIEDCHFHDLRHTFASHLVMNGASLKEVQELLGHATMTMTLRYAHFSQESKKKAVSLLNGLTAVTEKPGVAQNGTF